MQKRHLQNPRKSKTEFGSGKERAGESESRILSGDLVSGTCPQLAWWELLHPGDEKDSFCCGDGGGSGLAFFSTCVFYTQQAIQVSTYGKNVEFQKKASQFFSL